MKPGLFFFALALWALTLWAGISSAVAAGFQTLEHNHLKVGVWYPSDMDETDGRLGPFDVRLAFDARLKPGHYQVILMSHGNSGRYRNHHLTAKALADAGFIVIAPEHSADHLVGTSKTFEALHWRTVELNHAFEMVLQIDMFRHAIDLSRIHALGYSLGTVTVLSSAGAGIDKSKVDAHCQKHDDPNFCDEPDFITRWSVKWKRDVKTPSFERDIPSKFWPKPSINGKVALIAPIGQGVVIEDNMFIAEQVLISGYVDDKINMPHFHAEPLSKIIPKDKLFDFSIREGHHSAFIAPFAKRVTDIEHIPVAIDPPGFDRIASLKMLNDDLVRYFRISLP